MKFGLNIPTKLVFGAGELKNLSAMTLPGKRALIVISAGTSMKKHGYLDMLVEQLDKAGVAHTTFDKISPNPTHAHVMQGTQVCLDHQCDFVIGLGGGSSIDTAKAIAITAAMGGDFWDYVSGGTGGGKPVERALPIVAIPTTAGTGTEVDLWGVVTNETTHEKMGFGSPHIFPTLAIVDPELMMSVPPRLTAYQGFDAFFHAAEGYISRAHTPISDLYALEAIRLLYKSACCRRRPRQPLGTHQGGMGKHAGRHGREHQLLHRPARHGTRTERPQARVASRRRTDCAVGALFQSV